MNKRGRKVAAVAYLRVSGQGQVEGHGFDRQLDAIEAFAGRDGYQVLKVYREAWTGTDADRPAFAQMLAELLENGAHTIIVESLDRFARELGVQIALLSRLRAEGLALISATTGENVTGAIAGDPMAEAMVAMQGVFAQAEKRRLVERLRKARDAASKVAGQRIEGRKAYGLHPDPKRREVERMAVARIRQLRRKPRGKEPLSYAKVAEVLNSEEVPTRTGRPWNAGVVRALDRRKRS